MKRDHGTSYARIGPTRVRVRTQGQGEPLLLVMGIGGSLDMWEPVAKHLPGRELVMFDFPGTRESTISWLPAIMAHNAFFLRQLLRRLDLQRVAVLGYSWAGHEQEGIRCGLARCRGYIHNDTADRKYRVGCQLVERIGDIRLAMSWVGQDLVTGSLVRPCRFGDLADEQAPERCPAAGGS